MADLWGVVIGGLLAITGSAATQWYAHKAKADEDRRRLREQKLEEMISLVYEHAHWIDAMRQRIVLDAKSSEETVSPMSKLTAIAAIYFPQFLEPIRVMERAALAYRGWMIGKGRERLAGRTDQLSEGFNSVYEGYLKAQQTLLKQLTAAASSEFGVRNNQPQTVPSDPDSPPASSPSSS
ncbi:hypothetical protein [Hyphomicrobium sp.]|uniref:hypothetical protein n=1 Tax=Hyphomicrobium sp. TaxID=82 RepID=UPI000F9A94EB|nr:hypothetical protein [Hyphomicrobium sp.]RUO97994.1 MAG: hypothetical protein EKK30_14825 [Hyphomicrobium sp.]